MARSYRLMLSPLGNLLLLTSLVVVESGNSNDPVNLLAALDGVGPFLCGLFFVIFSLHLLIQPNWSMLDLMETYIKEGTTVSGCVLDCEPRHGSSSGLAAKENAVSGSQLFLVECMWECKEHKYADNPSMKFRYPDAYVTKTFVRRFEMDQELPVGVEIDVLLPRGCIQPRSGCPTIVVERTLAQEMTRLHQNRLILGAGLVVIGVLVGFTILQIQEMDNPTNGWIVLGTSLALMEIVSVLYNADQFLKKKRRVYDAAQVMVSVDEQEARRQARAAAPPKTADPFSIPLNEFAGHARATERRH